MRPRTIRGRVAGWVLLIVTVALSLNLLAVTAYLHGRDRAAVETELEHESVKFHRFVRAETGTANASVSRVLRAYVAQAFPDTNESIFSVVNGRAEYRTPRADRVRLDLHEPLVRRASRTTKPVTVALATVDGPAVAAIIPVRASKEAGDRGALVVVESTQARRESIIETVRLLGVLGLGALSIAGLVSWLVAGRVAAPLRQVRRTAEKIDEEQISARIPIDGSLDDDVTSMATTFNRMLDRLECAMESQREFLDDAAHEMRTPLTVIRGHLETTGQSPAERCATTKLLVGEVARMDRLVADLLVLAKSARPDFLTRHVVDLDDLVVRVVATASALGERQWRVVGTADARVLADEQRLTQALMQLAANAVDHTSTGDTIAVGVRTRASSFELTVTDNGPGVPEEERHRIFDRFHQGAPHRRTRSTGHSTGLGLAIVRSIAQAHGGHAEVTTALGGGARFALVLPRHDVADFVSPHPNPVSR